ncbi:ATP-dependent DNA ligase [Streptomyces sp. VRA16 Mangrove soil]|uniref:ATP-dependent DNA ligase n=1 Tax=Streptomyces sp. VRA16 Mangrove soil TaxID=2817434 RepID=UPI001A9DFDA8|nr:ATP-dependent DNA ligase [Streptomyces sp. VRA16 Mangrove soil]MBO1336181.1 ATP-dependent DNA ligase [Streptomyces sp. VRA16 Mangrove soil]
MTPEPVPPKPPAPARTSPIESPVAVALAEPVDALPAGDGWAYEPKFDGHRMVVIRDGDDGDGADGVRLQARSGRIVGRAFPDLVAAATELAPGTVLDGEVVVWHDGRTDFAAVQRRAAAASAARARTLARELPASYAAFDLLAEGGADLRGLPYSERRDRLVRLLAPLGPPLQAVPSTTDRDTALTWYETLPATGVEGLVAKRLDGPYRGGRRVWRKLRHSDTHDAAVIGFTGPHTAPRALVVALPGDGTPVLTTPLGAGLRAEAAALLPPASGEEATLIAVGVGEVTYQLLDGIGELTLEVRQHSTRHGAFSAAPVRFRLDDGR